MSNRSSTRIIVLAAVLLHSVWCSDVQASLKAGGARVDITPPVGVWLSGYRHRNKPSIGIEDKLYAKALVVDDGQNKTAIVSADLLWVPLEITSEVRKKVKDEIGIAEENVLICATHTHFGPKIDRITKDWPDAPASEVDKSYVQGLGQKLVDVILAANKDLKEARLGAIKGQISELSYNRRTKKADGAVEMTFNLPPASPELTFGPIDPEVCILRVEDTNGGLVGAIVNFACHPVSGDQDKEKFYHISADYPGYTAKVIEQAEGGVCLFALGTAGNMNPIRINMAQPRSQTGKALGGEVLRRIQFVPTSGEAPLRAMKKEVVLPVKTDLPAERVKEEDKGKKTLTTEIQVLRLGDIYFLGLPSEVLVEIGLGIKKEAGIEDLFIVSLSNDTCGYICPKQAYKEGGYEPGSGTNLAEGAGEIIAVEAAKLLSLMKQGK